MVILRTRNKITDFLMILAWASPFKWFCNTLKTVHSVDEKIMTWEQPTNDAMRWVIIKKNGVILMQPEVSAVNCRFQLCITFYKYDNATSQAAFSLLFSLDLLFYIQCLFRLDNRDE